MITELDSARFRALASAPDVSALLPTYGPQQGDMPQVLLAKVAASLQRASQPTGWVRDEAGVLQRVLKGAVNVAAGTATGELVALTALKKIRVLDMLMVTGATATDSTFKSATTAISPVIANGVNGGVMMPRNDDGWFETAAGEALNVTTGAGSSTGYLFHYILVPDYLTDPDGVVLTDENGIPLLA